MCDVTRENMASMEKLDDSKPALSSWRHTHQFYDGASIITELYSWDNKPNSPYSSISGFDCAYELTITFVERHTGEVEDTHYHYVASGGTISKIKRDFKKRVFPLWKVARRLVSDFPAYTLTNLENILDPAINNQPEYFGLRPGYIELKAPTLKGSALTASFTTVTQKGTAQYFTDIQYNRLGEINAVDCLIRRRSDCYELRIRNSANGLYPKMIDHYKIGRKDKNRLFEATSYSDFALRTNKRGIAIAPQENTQYMQRSQVEKPSRKEKTHQPNWLSLEQTDKLRSAWENNKLALRLTPRQLELLCHLCRGTRRDEIAQKMGITRETMKSNIKKLYRLLSTHDINSLVAWARGQIK